MNKQEILNKISDLLDEYKVSNSKLAFEDHNFRINSDGWKKITVGEKMYLENPTKDVWEHLGGEYKYKGEQLFTWDAGMRETKKAGKTIPSNEQFTDLLKTKSDMPNILYAGYRYTDGSFLGIGSCVDFWSSLQSGGSAWKRGLNSGYTRVYSCTYDKAFGFSVRCLK